MSGRPIAEGVSRRRRPSIHRARGEVTQLAEQQALRRSRLHKAMEVAMTKGNNEAVSKLRLVLSQLGERCERCQLTGYRRSNCPQCNAAVQLEQPDLAVDETGGYYWGNKAPHAAKNVYDEFASATQLVDYKFFAEKTGCGQQPTAVETHRAVMQKVAIVLEKELKECMDTSAAKAQLFIPPKEKPTAQYYPDAVFAEDKHYFAQEKSKERQHHRSYKYNGYSRPSEQLDAFFRGPNKSQGQYYQPPKNAGASIHGRVGWKNVTATNDLHAVSDLDQAREMEELTRLFQTQSQWVHLRQANSEIRRKRCLHLLSVLRSETIKEHAREHELLSLEGNQLRKRQADVTKERLGSADRMMRILVGYGLISGAAEADYLRLATDHDNNFELFPQQGSKLSQHGSTSSMSLPSTKSKKSITQRSLCTTSTGATRRSQSRLSNPSAGVKTEASQAARLWNRLAEQQLDKDSDAHLNKSYSIVTQQPMRNFQSTICDRPHGKCICSSVLARSFCAFKHGEPAGVSESAR